MAQLEAIGTGDITKIGVGVIIALVLVGILLSMVITAIIGRIVIAVVVVVLAVLVWQQRTSVKDDLTKHACNLNTTFFGVHVDPPQDVRQYCLQHGS